MPKPFKGVSRHRAPLVLCTLLLNACAGSNWFATESAPMQARVYGKVIGTATCTRPMTVQQQQAQGCGARALRTTVTVRSRERDWSESAATGESGEFEFSVAPGRYELSVPKKGVHGATSLQIELLANENRELWIRQPTRTR